MYLFQKLFKALCFLGCVLFVFQLWSPPEEDHVEDLMREMQEFGNIFNTTEAAPHEVDCDKRKYIVYQCYEICGGLGDRQKGIVSAYLLAVLTGRTFVIDMPFPCQLEIFMQPNKYNWRTCKHFALSVPDTDNVRYYTIDDKENYENIFTSSDIRYSWKTQVVTLNINWYATGIIRHYLNSASVPALEWIRGTRDERVVHKVMNELFTPVEAVTKKVDTFLDKNVGNKTLVCGHIRVGQNPTLPNDVSFSRIRGHPDVKKLLNFLSVYSDKRRFAIYVATDSDYVRRKATELFKNFVSLNRTILHIDRLKVSKELGCVGFFNAVIEQLLLTKCDVLLLTMSNFGVIAALMRGRAEGIFTYTTKDNSIANVLLWEIFNKYYLD